MNVREVRAIREKLSLQTKGMTAEQLNNFYRESTEKALKTIEEMRNLETKSLKKKAQ